MSNGINPYIGAAAQQTIADSLIEAQRNIKKGRIEQAVGQQEFKKMYQDESLTAVEMGKLKTKVDKLLSFLNDMAYARKNSIRKGLYWKEFVMLSRLYFYMEDTYKDFDVIDNTEFYLEFKKVFDLYTGDHSRGKYKKLINLV